MAAVSWLVHGIHSDAPFCASPAISAYVVHGNDAMPDDVRQRLLPYLHRIAGSRSDEYEVARRRILWLAAVRVFVPIALDAAGLHKHAKLLRDLPDDVTPERAAAVAARAAAEAEAAATCAVAAARAAAWAAEAGAWDVYFDVLDAVLNAGPQGEAWSADAMNTAVSQFEMAGRR